MFVTLFKSSLCQRVFSREKKHYNVAKFSTKLDRITNSASLPASAKGSRPLSALHIIPWQRKECRQIADNAVIASQHNDKPTFRYLDEHFSTTEAGGSSMYATISATHRQNKPHQDSEEGVASSQPDYPACSSLETTRVTSGAETDQSTEDITSEQASSILFVDLDEAVHGVYAAASYAIKALKGHGSEEIVRQLHAEAQQLVNTPVQWIQQTGTAQGLADVVTSITMGAVLIPLSLLALKAGKEEFSLAREEKSRLKLQQSALLEQQKMLNNAFADMNEVKVLQVINQQKLRALAFSRQQNDDTGKIGFFSFSSGISIIAKVSLETIAKCISVSATGPMVTALTTVAGVCNTVILAPFAAVSAVGLGAYMARVSGAKMKAFGAEKRSAINRYDHDSFLQGSSLPSVSNLCLDHYRQFLRQKLDQHEKFHKSFRNWNRGFFAGGTFYTVSALGHLSVLIAAGSGVAVIVSPLILGILLISGSIGGVIMGLCSHQFLFGHSRFQRYDNYFKQDDADLDRHFLATVDLFLTGNTASGPLAGEELRADFYHKIYRQEEIRQNLLQRIAEDTGKIFIGRYVYTADTEETRKKRGDQPIGNRRVKATLLRYKDQSKAGLFSAQAFARQLPHGSLENARHSAHDMWNSERTILTKSHLADWLKTHDVSIEMKEIVDLQLSTLSRRLKFKAQVYERVTSSGQRTGSTPYADSENQQQSMTSKIIESATNELSRQLQSGKELLHQLAEFRQTLNRSVDTDDQKTERILRFISLQQGRICSQPDGEVTLNQSLHRLARYLLDEAPSRYRNLRGKLLETELQSLRLRQLFSATAESVDLQCNSTARVPDLHKSNGSMGGEGFLSNQSLKVLSGGSDRNG